jgi:hypothetical protein
MDIKEVGAQAFANSLREDGLVNVRTGSRGD